MINNIKITVLSGILFGFLLSSCVLNPKKPGRIFMPDMTYSNAYETYSTTKNPTLGEKADTMTARLPVEGTIPRGFIPEGENIRSNEAYLSSFILKNLMVQDPDQYQANYERSGELQNPIPLTQDVLTEVKNTYTTFCTVCHGSNGAGDGSIVVLPDGSDGPYTAIPPTYESRLPTIKDGQMFYSITYGKNMMGGYGPQISAEDRWKLVHYIKDMTGMYTEADFIAPSVENDNQTAVTNE